MSRLCDSLSAAIDAGGIIIAGLPETLQRNSSGRVSIMPLIVSAGPTTISPSSGSACGFAECTADAEDIVSAPASVCGPGAGALAGNGGLTQALATAAAETLLVFVCFDCWGAADDATTFVLCLGIGGASPRGTSKSQVVTFSELRAVELGIDDVMTIMLRIPQVDADDDETALAKLCILDAIDRLVLLCCCCCCLNCWLLLGVLLLLLAVDLRGGSGGAISSLCGLW